MILRVDSACFRLCFCDNSSSNDNSDRRYTYIIMALPVHELQRNVIYLHTLCRYTLNSFFVVLRYLKSFFSATAFLLDSSPHKLSFFLRTLWSSNDSVVCLSTATLPHHPRSPRLRRRATSPTRHLVPNVSPGHTYCQKRCKLIRSVWHQDLCFL